MVKASLMVKTDFELLSSLPCPPCILMSVVGGLSGAWISPWHSENSQLTSLTIVQLPFVGFT